MKKRFKFQCWNCDKTYTLHRRITKDMTLFVACPYCEKEAVVDLKPYHKKKKEVLRSGDGGEQDLGLELQLPETLPTIEANQDSKTE